MTVHKHGCRSMSDTTPLNPERGGVSGLAEACSSTSSIFGDTSQQYAAVPFDCEPVTDLTMASLDEGGPLAYHRH